MAISAKIKDVDVHAGDIVRVYQRILEGDKERTQIFEGMVISIRGRGENRTFSIRKISAAGIGVEKIFPFESPWVSKIEVKKQAGHVRRAKLNYVREKSARQVAQITVQQSEN